ncbi:MAG: FHA domain-containing protein [Chloroflexi bacterium]|nr:FHA domain-containing protein [Chloroflexota bacterium]
MTQIRTLWRFCILLVVISLMLPAISARASGNAFAEISTPDTSKFPLITTYLDAFDDQGNFITNLSPAEVSILENGQQIVPDKLENLGTPLSLVLAINSDQALAVRDGSGISRYAKELSALSAWSAARPSNSLDKLALVWNGGMIASRLTPSQWKTRLESFDPALRTSTNGLAALAFALDASQEAETSPGVKKTIFLISGHLAQKDIDGMNALIDRAKQMKVRVFVWITDSKTFLNNPGTLALQDLALATGGRYTIFTANETLPNPEEWVGSLRNFYQLSYTSKIRVGGQQTLSAQVNALSLALSSPAVNFQIDIQPPSATLLSAPIQIVRQNPDSPFDLESFEPKQQEISALVEFPDGLHRALKRSTLYVDGQKIAENTAEPFTHFNWDVSSYVVSAQHSLQVEVEDVLGLSQMSAEVPVQVTVIQPPGGMAGLILRNRMAVTITFLVLAGAVVLGIIILGGRRGLTSLAERRKARAARLDPVTQPVLAPVEIPNAARANPFPWLRRKETPPPAYLARLRPDGTPGQGDPIPLNNHEITFGTDPTQATIVLNNASISLLHARLRHGDDLVFTLLDQNSTAGTWVNYEKISEEGYTLKHGDIIHFGHMLFRFVITKPPAASKPTITPIMTDDPHS